MAVNGLALGRPDARRQKLLKAARTEDRALTASRTS